jgi:hypothetical protein
MHRKVAIALTSAVLAVPLGTDAAGALTPRAVRG